MNKFTVVKQSILEIRTNVNKSLDDFLNFNFFVETKLFLGCDFVVPRSRDSAWRQQVLVPRRHLVNRVYLRGDGV